MCCGDRIDLVDEGYILIDKCVESYQKDRIQKLIEEGKFLQLDINTDKLPFENDSVDEIYSCRGIGRGYITNLNEVMRILKSDGKMFLYNSYHTMLPILMMLFENINIKHMNGHYKDRIEDHDFLFTCYNKYEFLKYN